MSKLYDEIGDIRTSLNFNSFATMLVVSSIPERIFLPKYRYSSPKHCEAPSPASKRKQIN